VKMFSELLSSFDPKHPNFRPTEIYQEGWLIKLVIHQASTIDDGNFYLSFLSKSTWYSESQLPTAFKARRRGDPLAESRTNADGVIGEIKIGSQAKVDLELVRGAKQFTVIEAKIGSSLSSGTKNAPYFDQAARNVACMAEVMAMAPINPESLERLDFIVLAPKYSIRQGTFSKEMTRGSIKSKVQRRVQDYKGRMNKWYSTHFEPTINKIRLHTLSWEEALRWISKNKPDVGDELEE